MMRLQRRKLQLIIGILKDKASNVKALAQASPARVAVLRATTHRPSTAPPDRHIDALLAKAGSGRGRRRSSAAYVNALMDRLARTRSAAVALKCLVVAHTILSRGSFVLRDHLSFRLGFDGHNSLNFSTFHDNSDAEAWELSRYVRWYARVVEQSHALSRVLGHHLHRPGFDNKNVKAIVSLSCSDVLPELNSLAGYLERASEAPVSFCELLRNALVYEVSRLVKEDYRQVQRETMRRVKQLGGMLTSLTDDELSLLINGLKRFEDCKMRMFSMYMSRKIDDDFWGLIGVLKINVAEIMFEKRLFIG